jgi:hypothetical protein
LITSLRVFRLPILAIDCLAQGKRQKAKIAALGSREEQNRVIPIAPTFDF